MIDLRSDTVTLPSPEMRKAMAEAPVGDDQYGEDRSINALEEQVASLLGKTKGLFVPSGTMANQVALRVLTEPGDEVVAGGEAHILWHEKGAASALGGVQISTIGSTGIFTAAEFKQIIKPRGHVVFPPTTLLVIENTHNRGGGVVVPQAAVEELVAVARANAIETYLDGARLFNASIASGLSLEALAAPFRMASVSLSKGLGCPVGSVLAGDDAAIDKARKFRRMYGGAMRQAGIVAAAGLYALKHNMDRLGEDHLKASAMAETLANARGVELDLDTVQTNIVLFRLKSDAVEAASIAQQAKEKGVLISPFSARSLRAVAHLNVSMDECRRAAGIVAEIVERNSL